MKNKEMAMSGQDTKVIATKKTQTAKISILERLFGRDFYIDRFVGSWLYDFLWWLRSGNPIVRFYRRIKRVASWIPFLWNDYEWDGNALLQIMEYKISRMRHDMEVNGCHSNDNKYISEMKHAEFLLRRLYSEDFYYEQSEAYKIRDGTCSCPEETFTWGPFENGLSRMIFHHCDFCEKNLKRWYLERDKKKKADQKYVFEYLAKKLDRWWT